MQNRRAFIRALGLGGAATTVNPVSLFGNERTEMAEPRSFNAPYSENYLNRIAFPIGGIGTGMFCLEGTGAISNVSLRHNPELFHEPTIFAAIAVAGKPGTGRVIEGQVPEWKKFGNRESGLGGIGGNTWGLPRFEKASFQTRFPFAEIALGDSEVPLDVSLCGWNPFIPGDSDNASLPVGALEYEFRNTGNTTDEFVFSYHSRNFMAQPETRNYIGAIENGFVLSADPTTASPEKKGQLAIFSSDTATVDHCWFRGGWFDPLTMLWNTVDRGDVSQSEVVERDAPGASIYIRFKLKPGEQKRIPVLFAWYVPDSRLRIGAVEGESSGEENKTFYKPWYSGRFKDVEEVAAYWKSNYAGLKKKTTLFTGAFYSATLPPEVMEAVAANLSILKSPTVMRQEDGRFWTWEGCGDHWGSCHGSCTHVWNYAQAVPHLFPDLERSLRETEFNENQNAEGHQSFRANIPISPTVHDFHSAADGQLGGIMKVYRDWRISGDDHWLAKLFPKVRTSLDYCIKTWDPQEIGVLEEPHHNTYDIEFWGPDGMCSSFYLGALLAMQKMGEYLQEDVSRYKGIYGRGVTYLENELFDGEFFIQQIRYEGLQAPDPAKAQSFGGEYSAEAIELLKKEGPKYQYGTGCLSDGVLGAWIARVCALPDPFDSGKIRSHLEAVHRYNLKQDLVRHVNPQRSTFAFGTDSGLLLCSWPKNGKLSLPFVYSDEVWTGIEYQVASHLMFSGEVNKGLEIVRACRSRYDGRIRNPFNEYECGSWYARALSSYACIEALTGVRYDAVDRILYVDSKIGDFVSFLSTGSGFGKVVVKGDDVRVEVVYGTIPVDRLKVEKKEARLYKS